MKAQMKYADRRFSPAAVILGGDELAAGQVTIKDLDLGRALASKVSDNAAWREEPARPGQRAARRAGGDRPAHRRVGAMILEPPVPADVLAAIRAPFADGWARPLVDAPVLQPLGLLLDLAGEAMRGRLFVVQGEGSAEACLRPDFTIPIARAHIAPRAGGDGRYLYEGKAFRVAPRGSGRAEQFLQIGLEAFGGARRGRRTTPRLRAWHGARRRRAGETTWS